MKVLLLLENPKNIILRDVELKPDESGSCLDAMYAFLKCSYVDYREICIEGIYFDVWFDDEFLLRSGPGKISLCYNLDYFPECCIAGPFLVAKSTPEGETVGLTESDANLFATWYMGQHLPALYCAWEKYRGQM